MQSPEPHTPRAPEQEPSAPTQQPTRPDPRERPTVRQRPVRTDIARRETPAESLGRYSHVYGRARD